MYEKWITLRDELIFDANGKNFARRCDAVAQRYEKRHEKVDAQGKRDIAQLVANVAVDLQSYLPAWTLKGNVADSLVLEKSELLLARVRAWGHGDIADAAKKEIASFAGSKLWKLSEMADAGKVNNRWGNDNGVGIMEWMRRGAALVTTNPPIVNMAREARPDVFDKVRDKIRADHPNASLDERISCLTMNVVLNNCRALRSIYRLTGGELGYANYQVSPESYKDADKMAEEIEFAYDAMSKALCGKPNVVFKVPGTQAALEAVRRVTAQGIGVTITVNFSVAQSAAFAEAIESGKPDVSYVVIMAGRLDDPIADELEQKGVANAKELSRLASKLVTQRVYKDVLLKNGHVHTEILVASLRGAWNFDASITDNTESRIVISSFPDKAEDYDGQPAEIVSAMDGSVLDAQMAELRKSDIFVKAYDFDGMQPQEFDDFIPVQQTLTSFIEVYGTLKNYVK